MTQAAEAEVRGPAEICEESADKATGDEEQPKTPLSARATIEIHRVNLNGWQRFRQRSGAANDKGVDTSVSSPLLCCFFPAGLLPRRRRQQNRG